MNLSLISGQLSKLKTEGVIFFVPEKGKLSEELKRLDKNLNGVISNAIKKGYFHRENKEIHSFYSHGKFQADKIILIGVGKKYQDDLENLRRLLALGIVSARESSLKNITVVLPETNAEIIEDLGTVAVMSTYNFVHYKTKDCSKIKYLSQINFYLKNESDLSKYQPHIKRAQTTGESINWTRDLINHPSNYLTPQILAQNAKELANKNLKVESFGQEQLEKMGMGLILGVAKGSDEEPRLIVLDYKPPREYSLENTRDKSGQAKKYQDTIVLAGKGITFDSGGISIKDSEKMDEMKMDMAGAGVVLGVMKLLSKLKLNKRVIGIIPATENMPSGKAIKPGDILTSASGLTVEIDDTDAEGRLILADALFYGQKYKPTAIVDLATLTGAALIVLGHEGAPIIGNNQKIIKKIEESAKRTGEKVWQLPLWDEYKEIMKSEIADLNNTGKTRKAGTITGAVFLENFVGKYPWVHLDIAGTAFSDKPKPYNTKGATGWGIRLIIDWLLNL